MTPEAHDLIQRLLDRDPKTRLGAHGAEEIKNHKFFTSKGKETFQLKFFLIEKFTFKNFFSSLKNLLIYFLLLTS